MFFTSYVDKCLSLIFLFYFYNTNLVIWQLVGWLSCCLSFFSFFLVQRKALNFFFYIFTIYKRNVFVDSSKYFMNVWVCCLCVLVSRAKYLWECICWLITIVYACAFYKKSSPEYFICSASFFFIKYINYNYIFVH